MNPDDVDIEYSTDKGKTWTKYYTITGTTDADKERSKTEINNYKTSFVTSGMSHQLFPGGDKSKNQTVEDQLRFTITARGGELYFSLKKILLHFSTGGAEGCHVKVEYNTNASSNFIDNGTYDITGWPGWTSIPFFTSFGGYAENHANVKSIRFTVYFDNHKSGYEKKTVFFVDKIAMYGEMIGL
jgi:hypothetical protein